MAIFPNDTQHGLHYVFHACPSSSLHFMPSAAAVHYQSVHTPAKKHHARAVSSCRHGVRFKVTTPKEFSFVVYEAAAGGLGALWFYLTHRIRPASCSRVSCYSAVVGIPTKSYRFGCRMGRPMALPNDAPTATANPIMTARAKLAKATT